MECSSDKETVFSLTSMGLVDPPKLVWNDQLLHAPISIHISGNLIRRILTLIMKIQLRKLP